MSVGVNREFLQRACECSLKRGIVCIRNEHISKRGEIPLFVNTSMVAMESCELYLLFGIRRLAIQYKQVYSVSVRRSSGSYIYVTVCDDYC